jgi:hypothetical protein
MNFIVVVQELRSRGQLLAIGFLQVISEIKNGLATDL